MARMEVQLTVALVLILFASLANTSNCEYKLDLITVLDGSGSIPKNDFIKLKSAVTDLIDGLNVSTGNHRVGAIVFSSNVSTKISLGYNARLIKSRISRIKQPKGGTRTYLGILEMTKIFRSQNRPGARKVGIVITDGRSSSLSKTRKAAQKAKAAGIHMFAVGVGTGFNKNELQSIASSPSYVLELADFNALQGSISSLLKRVCQVDGAWSSWSTIAYGRCSSTCGGGTKTVIRTRTCTNPSPSNGGKCCKGSATQRMKKRCNTQPCSVCEHKLDLIIVLDGSGSIPKNDFIKLKSAVTDLIDGLNVSTGNQRVGAVVFSSNVSTKISLGYNARLIKSRISRIKQPKGGTRTYLGILEMTKIFRSQNRPGARKVGIVITDGRSSSLSKTRKAALKAKAAGILMFAVGVGTKINKNELRAIASSPSYVMELSDFNALQNTISSLVKKVCQVETIWSSWSTSTYGRCSATCGGGTRTIIRTRTCTNPSPVNGDESCIGSVIQREKRRCNTQPCQVNGRWSGWCVKRGPCSASCGGGKRIITKSRTCTYPSPSKFGKVCVGRSTKIYKETCNKQKCPDLCNRSMEVTLETCPDEPVSKRSSCCDRRKTRAVNGGWSRWRITRRSRCSVTCGGGTRTVIRARTCTNPRPRRRGKGCVGLGRETIKEACNSQKCRYM